jgi:hypothetical protein
VGRLPVAADSLLAQASCALLLPLLFCIVAAPAELQCVQFQECRLQVWIGGEPGGEALSGEPGELFSFIKVVLAHSVDHEEPTEINFTDGVQRDLPCKGRRAHEAVGLDAGAGIKGRAKKGGEKVVEESAPTALREALFGLWPG